jgi:hypothetical protein
MKAASNRSMQGDENAMIRTMKSVIVTLGLAGALDLVAAALATQVTGPAKPPPPAVVVMVICGILTFVAMYGLWRGAGWARPVIYVTRGLDAVSSLLGLADGPSPALVAIGVGTLVLSLGVIAILVRTSNTELTPSHEWE